MDRPDTDTTQDPSKTHDVTNMDGTATRHEMRDHQ